MNSVNAAEPARNFGAIERIAGDRVVGWIFDETGDPGGSSREVEILVDDKPVGRCRPSTALAAEHAPLQRPHMYGFTFSLSDVAAAASSEPNLVSCRFADAPSTELWGSPMPWPRRGTFAGGIDHVEDGLIEGWAVDRTRLDRRLFVVAYDRGTMAGCGWTGGGTLPTISRDGLRGDFGFRLQVDRLTGMAVARRLSIVLANSDFELDGSPVAISLRNAPTTRPFGFILD